MQTFKSEKGQRSYGMENCAFDDGPVDYIWSQNTKDKRKSQVLCICVHVCTSVSSAEMCNQPC